MSNVVELSEKKGGPMMEKITDPQIRERVLSAQTWLNDQYKAKKTWSKVASSIGGYDEAAFGLFASGKYPASPMKMLVSIERARDVSDERAANVFRPEFVDTSIAKKLRRALRQTRSRGMLGIVSTQSGLGKSTTWADVCRNDPRVLYFRANPTLRGKGRLWPTIAQLLVAAGSHASGKGGPSPAHAYKALAETFTASRKDLIVDEAQFVSQEGLDALRCLSEDAEIAILFSGNESLYERGMMSGVENPAGFVQFQSRCSVEEYIRTEQITPNDVALIAGQILDEETLAEVGDVLHVQAQASGGFRRLISVLQRAHEKAKGGTISQAHIYSVIKEMSQRGGGA
jgi:DNA transposition AAA+ family ATPase